MTRLLALSILLLPVPSRQDDDILGVPEWHGFIRMTLVNEGTLTTTSDTETTEHRWEDRRELYVEGVLDHRLNSATIFPLADPASQTEKGRYQSWAAATKHKTPDTIMVRDLTYSKYIETGKGEADSVITDTFTKATRRDGTGQARAGMRLQADRKAGKFVFLLPTKADLLIKTKRGEEKAHRHEQTPSGIDETTFDDDGPTLPVEIDPVGLQAVDRIEGDLPSGAPSIQGTRRFPFRPAKPVKAQGKFELYLEVQWSFTPKPPDRYTVELEAIPDKGSYHDWRPLCGPNENAPGTIVKLIARLIGPRADNSDRLRKLSIRMTEVSRVPGISINYPVNPPGPIKDDLRFMPSPDVKLKDKEAYTTDEKVAELVVELGCFDAGAWAELVVDCDLQSGRFVRGTVKGTGAKLLLLPYRHPSSKIAASWKSPGKDVDDADGKPIGDASVKGDGLTNYEEYRGFHVQGTWKEGDPETKDFFVRDDTGGLAEPGIKLFESLSKLRLHRLGKDEFPASRVINENRAPDLHAVDQHGILIKSDPTMGDYCQAQTGSGKPGIPQDVRQLVLGRIPTHTVTPHVTGVGPGPVMPYLAPSVAHELFHCVNVWHHGDHPDEGKRSWSKSPAGVITEGPTTISAVNEAGADITSLVTFPINGVLKQIDLGRFGGRASGDMGCVMRYDSMEGRIEDGPKRTVFFGLSRSNVVGAGLCTTRDGNPPNIRFGPATRGVCTSQIHVNDAVPARPR